MLYKNFLKSLTGCLLLLCFSSQVLYAGGPNVLIIETNGKKIKKEDEIQAKIAIVEKPLSGREVPSIEAVVKNRDEYDKLPWKTIEIKRRGNSSDKLFKKKQYKIEFIDDKGEETEFSLLGLPEASSWVLNGAYSDRSSVRNALTYTLGQKLGETRGAKFFAPRSKFVEVFINGKYKGLYNVFDRIERDKNRVDVPKIDPEKLEKICYIANLNTTLERSKYTSDKGTKIEFCYPSENNLAKWDQKQPRVSVEIMNRVMKDIQNFENNLYAFSCDHSKTDYRQLVDLDSVVDFVIMQEVTKNVDAYRRSAHFYKKKSDGKIAFGPLWDFDMALGNFFFPTYKVHSVKGWHYPRKFFIDFLKPPFWFRTMMEDPEVKQKFIARYKELRKEGNALSNNVLLSTIDEMKTEIREAGPRNYAKWGKITNPLIYFIFDRPPYKKGFDANFEKMRGWLLARLQWMDENIDKI